MSVTVEGDTLTHRYEPRGAARELFRCRAPEVLMVGSAGTGKSRGVLEKLHAMALANPGMRGLIVRKTAVSLAQSTLVTFDEKVLPASEAAGLVRFFGGSPRKAPGYLFDTGSVINIGGMDKPSKIMSTEYDVIVVDEATELLENDWESLTTRLRNGKVSFQQIIGACNPDKPTHWLKARGDRGALVTLTSRHVDNPRYVSRDGQPTTEGANYLAKLDALTGVRRARLRDGIWAAAEGLVFDEWSDALHLMPNTWMPPRTWRRWWSIDFGYRNPFVCQWWAEDPDGRLYLYREIYRTGTLVEDHARAIKAATFTGEPAPSAIICDHDAEDRATLERHLGMSTIAARKTVQDGIQAVQSRMRPDDTGKPKIFFRREAVVHRDPTLVEARKPACTVEEFPGYVWEDRLAKEAPVKEDDHGMDAMRYMVAHRDMSTRVGVRWLG